MEISGSRPLVVAEWIARIVVAAILLQTLFFKFSGAPESIHIFETVGQEPWGRYGSGIVELCAGILILIPRTTAIGAVLALGVMAGAVFFHLTALGVEVLDDGGLLFALAWIVIAASGFLLVLHRRSLPILGARL